jgi:hypothetical protein
VGIDGRILTSIVASPYPADKILNNIEYQNSNEKNSEAFFDNAPINLEWFFLKKC